MNAGLYGDNIFSFLRKRYHANTNQKKVGVAILIWDKADFGPREITKDKG